MVLAVFVSTAVGINLMASEDGDVAQTSLEVEVGGVEVSVGDTDEPEPGDDVRFGDWLGYNSAQSDMTWLASDEYGGFSVESFPTLDLGSDAALVFGTGFHFMGGPLSPSDMPARLFDFQMAYHARKQLTHRTYLDLKFGVGAFSDFEGSARKGVRYPGHAVTYHEHNDRFITLFGVDVLDRDDISLLPVAGFVIRPHDDLLWELVFPKPKLQMRVGECQALYVSGELGGDTWAIERENRAYDNATYRDIRVLFGLKSFGKNSDGVLELGFAFDRKLEYRSARGNTEFDNAFVLRCRAHY